MKKKNQKNRDLKKKVQPFSLPLCRSSDAHECLKMGMERQIAANILPGKHNKHLLVPLRTEQLRHYIR